MILNGFYNGFKFDERKNVLISLMVFLWVVIPTTTAATRPTPLTPRRVAP